MGSKYSFSISVKNFWTILVPAILIFLALGGVAGFLFVDKVIMPNFTDLQNKNDVVVPSLVGLNVEAAAQNAFDLGLRIIRRKNREYSDNAPYNSVLSQEPSAGEYVKKGRHIFVSLSNGAEVGEIPNVRELAEGPAKSTLRQAGFENISVKIDFDKEIPALFAVETNPPANTKTSRSVPVVLLISKGQKPTSVIVPNLVGEMFSEVRGKIEDKGLKLGDVGYKSSQLMGAGQIISQSLSPGKEVPFGSMINVVVAVER
ncbi:MAG: PASTA domain-containing protein [Chitinispirillales bacterium]|jgi:serine/threonine-protein kinase|nr:PASTA domain-containing protein [Chitinispirillales bacterium]